MTSPVWADRVQETFTTTGTGPVSLAGAITGYQAFSSVMANAGTCYYCMTDGTNWEVGLGTYATSGNTLTRTTVTASSNAGAAVNWAAGTKSVWLDLAASAIANFTTPPAATAGSLGLVQPDGSIITVSGGLITVAQATSGAFGAVKVDGSTIVASAGVITASTATSSTLGVVRPDNSTITISGGVLTASSGSSVTPLGVGSIVIASLGIGFVSAGGTVSGSQLTATAFGTSGTPGATGNTLSGTWQALQSYAATGSQQIGLWQRTA